MSNNKQSMKLYTTDQVVDIFEKYGNMSAINARNILDLSESIELPSDEDIEPVKALEEDSDWYLIPNKLCDEFKNDTYNEEMVDSGGFDDKWWKYKTGGDLNLIQLYAKIQGGNK